MKIDDKTTLVNIKIKAGRTARDLWLFLKLFSVFIIFLGLIAYWQISLCQTKQPGKKWNECLTRARGEK